MGMFLKGDSPKFPSYGENRAAYIQFITTKLSMIDILVKEAEDAR